MTRLGWSLGRRRDPGCPSMTISSRFRTARSAHPRALATAAFAPVVSSPVTLKLGLELPYTEMGDRAALISLARRAEGLGYDAIWCSELYSFDSFTTLTQIACETERIKLGTNIANIYARTPAMLAGTAASLDQLSGGRFILGIGVSGPQVIEGWHGVPYDRPLKRTRETIEIGRQIIYGDRLVQEG